MKSSTQFLALFGRVVIGGLFLMSGLSKVGGYTGITAAITAAGLPLAPVGFGITLAVEIGMGLLLLVGYQARLAALGLAIWCIVTAVFFHRNFADQNQMIHFLKNVMMAGGLLQIVHFGAGAVSFEGRNRAKSLDRGAKAA
jgi:putative oxidoreductase